MGQTAAEFEFRPLACDDDLKDRQILERLGFFQVCAGGRAEIDCGPGLFSEEHPLHHRLAGIDKQQRPFKPRPQRDSDKQQPAE
ncbi:MAG: hypothetical protein NT069_29700 [Planctomycetota bacterium]|nr:hypothetical protein [Planctomycetota bacterium]